jgi:hypothetical protein
MPYKDPEKRRECNRKKNKVYREKNLEELQAKARERYAQAHPPQPKKTKWTEEYTREYRRAYREANKEKSKAYSKKWHQENYNKERMRECAKTWRKANPERWKELQKKYRDNNKEHVKQTVKKAAQRRFAENPEKIRAQRQEAKQRLLVKDPEGYLQKRRAYICKANKKLVAEIRDNYVAHLLYKSTGFSLLAKDIPKELIEAKRLQLMIKRELNK